MENNGQDIVVLDEPNAYMDMIRGEVDIQIATAHKYPREISISEGRILQLATRTEDIAAACFYALPRGGKPIEGPSVRLAEIVASCYGNLRTGSRVIHVGKKEVTLQAVCHDLETNNAVSVEVRRKIQYKNGERFNDDMINITTRAGLAIAFRNAVFKTVPMSLFDNLEYKIRQAANGDEKTFSVRVAAAFDVFEKAGFGRKHVLTLLERNDVSDVGYQDLRILRGVMTAVKDGDTSYDEVFKAVDPDISKKKGSAGLKEDLTRKRPDKKQEARFRLEETMAAKGVNWSDFCERMGCDFDEVDNFTEQQYIDETALVGTWGAINIDLDN